MSKQEKNIDSRFTYVEKYLEDLKRKGEEVPKIQLKMDGHIKN